MKNRHITNEEQQFIENFGNVVVTESYPRSQSITGIIVKTSTSLLGTTAKISNVKFKLPEVLKWIVTFAIQCQTHSPLSLLLIFVEFLSVIFEKSKKYLTESECAVLLSLMKALDNTNGFVNEEELMQQTLTDYPQIEEEGFYKSMSKLLHLECIEIINGNVSLIETVQVKYDF